MSELKTKLLQILPKESIMENEPLSKHTTFKIGGPANYLLRPDNEAQIIQIIKLLKKEKLPYYVIGNGSNLLVSDKGFFGVIIELNKNISDYTIEEKEEKAFVIAKSGILLIKLAKYISNKGYSGFEFATGIPGTLGGAITMNAGAYGGEIKDHIIWAKVLDKDGNLLTLNHEQLKLGYRTSIIGVENYIVLEAAFEFSKGNQEEINNKIKDLTEQRKSKQPLEFPSAGSTFKRPEGHFAGKLIMDSGLRGYKVGNIQVSEKHCGFVINLGDGKAKDVIKLIADVDKIVYDKYDVHLEPEIKIIGEI